MSRNGHTQPHSEVADSGRSIALLTEASLSSAPEVARRVSVADDVVIASERDLKAVLAPLARAKRMVFIAGLPGVGKSLFIRELALAAHAAGRTVHLLQWDVVRPAFVSPAIDARYPGRDGVTHAVIRKAVSQWSRSAVLRWDREHDEAHILIGEVPLIGNRLLDLAQAQADDAEPLLTGQDALFVTPVPSIALRTVIEGARGRTFANPAHPRESADAPPQRVANGLAGSAHARRGDRRHHAGL